MTVPTDNAIVKRPRDTKPALQEIASNPSHETFLVADIHAALTTKQRLTVLRKLQVSLVPTTNGTPHPSSLSTQYLEAGILNALTIQLHHLIHRHGSTITEVDLLCSCVATMFEQCRKHNLLHQYVESKGDDFLILLTQAVLFSLRRRIADVPKLSTLPPVPNCPQSVLVIFNIISSFANGAHLLVESKTVIPTIITLMYDNEATAVSRGEILGFLKNVTYWEESSHSRLLQQQRFLPGLARLSCRPHHSIKSLQRLSAVFRNLATSPDCRILLVRQPCAIGALVKLMTISGSSMNTTEEPDLLTLDKNLLNCLLSLAMEKEVALVLLFHGDGILLKVLKRYLTHHDAKIRKKASSTIRLLAHDTSTPLLIHNGDLMKTLSEAALNDPCAYVREEAAECFAKCAALAKAEQQPHFEAVLDALTLLVSLPKTKQSKSIVSMDTLALTLRDQSRNQCNRVAMVSRPLLLDTIANLALLRTEAPSFVTQDACCTLMYLSIEEKNRATMVLTPKILDALLSNLSSFQPPVLGHAMPVVGSPTSSRSRHESGKEHAIQALANLAKEPSARTVMAHHSCLMQTLIQVTRALDKEAGTLKAALKIVILLLANEL